MRRTLGLVAAVAAGAIGGAFRLPWAAAQGMHVVFRECMPPACKAGSHTLLNHPSRCCYLLCHGNARSASWRLCCRDVGSLSYTHLPGSLPGSRYAAIANPTPTIRSTCRPHPGPHVGSAPRRAWPAVRAQHGRRRPLCRSISHCGAHLHASQQRHIHTGAWVQAGANATQCIGCTCGCSFHCCARCGSKKHGQGRQVARYPAAAVFWIQSCHDQVVHALAIPKAAYS